VRDWSLSGDRVLFPYEGNGSGLNKQALKWLWPLKSTLQQRKRFGKAIEDIENVKWFELREFYPRRFRGEMVLTFSFVATHNHFAIDRSGRVTNRHAPVLQLNEGATEDEYLALLGILNSSTACFWLKQKSHDKGIRGEGGGFTSSDWERFYEFTGTTLKDFPLPLDLSAERARSLDEAALEATMLFESATSADCKMPSADDLDSLRASIESIQARMIAEQEELDWSIYRAYQLIDDDLTYVDGDLPELRLGERAFEIALARKVAVGKDSAEWFTRHGSTPITEFSAHWPQAYRDLVQRRLDLIESNKFIHLLESPEHKRRWLAEPWEKRVEKALRGWLLDRLEDRTYWFDAQGRPIARSVGQLADVVSRDADLVSVLELWSGRRDWSVVRQLAALLEDESVPFLPVYRLKVSGLRKREAWEQIWDLQRREDRGETVGTIPVPPKYTSADFRKPSWWQHRGKLDVPKERFILYPDFGRETDSTQLLGWAGWDHAQQALALATIIAEREAEGWSDERLVPLVAGLAELQPWVRQWHDETNSTYQLNLADYLDEELRGRASQVGLTLDQLKTWQPAPSSRRHKPKV